MRLFTWSSSSAFNRTGTIFTCLPHTGSIFPSHHGTTVFASLDRGSSAFGSLRYNRFLRFALLWFLGVTLGSIFWLGIARRETEVVTRLVKLMNERQPLQFC